MENDKELGPGSPINHTNCSLSYCNDAVILKDYSRNSWHVSYTNSVGNKTKGTWYKSKCVLREIEIDEDEVDKNTIFNTELKIGDKICRVGKTYITGTITDEFTARDGIEFWTVLLNGGGITDWFKSMTIPLPEEKTNKISNDDAVDAFSYTMHGTNIHSKLEELANREYFSPVTNRLKPEKKMKSEIIVYKENDKVVRTTIDGNSINMLSANDIVDSIKTAKANSAMLKGINGIYAKQEKERLAAYVKQATKLLDDKFATIEVKAK